MKRESVEEENRRLRNGIEQALAELELDGLEMCPAHETLTQLVQRSDRRKERSR